jgi:hypothetical protein
MPAGTAFGTGELLGMSGAPFLKKEDVPEDHPGLNEPSDA